MDHIIQALERAKAGEPGVKAEQPAAQERASGARRGAPINDVELNTSHLESMRVLAHNVADPRSKSFDLLRTQLLHAMDANGWRILAVTSPTPGCGKTFTAVNLALSIARQPECRVLLADLDLRKPQIAQRLGVNCTTGLRSLLESRASLQQVLTNVSVGELHLTLLPCERPSSRSSDLMNSPRMTSMLESIKTDKAFKVTVLDLPPMLSGDEVLSVLPHVDCVLMVAAVGTTKTTELKECANFMRSTPLVRMVLNKVPDVPSGYGY